MRIFLESGHGLFFMGLIFAIGFLMKGAVSFRYRRLIAGAGNLKDSTQKQLKQLKTRFENTYHIGGDVPYLDAFVDNSVCQIRAMGIRAARLNSLGGQAIFISVCLGAAMAAGSWFYALAGNWIFYYLGAGALLAALGAIFTGIFNIREKQDFLKAVLKDQLGNVWKAQLHQAEAQKEMKEEKRGQEIAYLKQSLDRIAASKELAADGKKEELTFTDSEKEAFEEILKEYFS